MSNYLISRKQMEEYAHYKDYARNVVDVRTYLEEKFQKPFSFMYANGMEWNMFYEDFKNKNENLQFLIRIVEFMSDKTLLIDEDDETIKEIVEPFNNSIFYYPEYEVAVAAISMFTTDGLRNNEYLFYSDEEKYIQFYEEAKRRNETLKEKEILIFTDGPKGVEREKKAVTSLIDRKQVVLEKKIKEDIYNSIDQFFKENQDFYQKYNIPHKRGILLYGEPGNGKTTLVKSLVGSIDSPVVYWQVNEFTNSSSVKTVFDMASHLSPVVLVIEDLDSLPPSTRSTFLNTLDGATTEEGVFLIGTTNYPERIDKALINRVGRFDRTYEIKLPSRELRVDYLKIRGMLDFVSQTQIEEIADKTEDFSFVQLSEVFRGVAYASYNGAEINIDDTIEALRENNRKTKKNAWNSSEEKFVGFQ